MRLPRELHGFDLHLYGLFMNLYGHVGLVLYGPSFVALHLNLYELVQTCMDCGLYKMFSDAYYDVWTIL